MFACLWLGALTGQASADDFTYHVRQAVFSDHQFFWPGLAEPVGKPAQEKLGALDKGIGNSREEFDKSGKSGKGRAGSDAVPVRLGVLPLRIVDYRESIPCDSCHRLSANAMEFYLENYLKDKLAGRFPTAKVELIAPHFALLQNRIMDLMAMLDSLDLPWARWFDDSAARAEPEAVIYRPRDRMTSAATRKKLDHLGGILNQNYLLLPTKVDIRVTPLMSNTHTGGFDWKFGLVFWNVAQGRPEWALEYSGKASLMDLDKSLDTHLDKALGAAWDGLPGELAALRNSEPR